MRRLLLIPLMSLIVACAPRSKQIVGPDSVLPTPPPGAPLGDWSAGTNRTPISVQVPGAILRGWMFEAGTGSPQKLKVLFFNGNAMTIDESQVIYRNIAVRGADVTVFDYRGYGFSTGRADVMDFRRDALALYDHEAASGPVVVYGFSLGSAIAAYVASQRKVAGVILAGTISTAAEEFPVFARAGGISPGQIASMVPSPDAIKAFDERGMIARSTAPLLMLHGEKDSLVPIAQGREVFAASQAKAKKFVAIPDTAHNDTASSPLALQSVGDFLRSLPARP